MIQDKITEDELVERIAKNLYEWHHPRIYHTFEELDSHFKGSAEGIRQQAVKILSLVREEIEKCLLSDEEIREIESKWFRTTGEKPDPEILIAKAQLQSILKALGG